jgi:hypothetical protein
VATAKGLGTTFAAVASGWEAHLRARPTLAEAAARESATRLAPGALPESAAGAIAGEAQRLLKPDRITRLGIRIGRPEPYHRTETDDCWQQRSQGSNAPIFTRNAELASALAVYPSGDVHLDIALRVRRLDRLDEGVFLIRAGARQIGNCHGEEASRHLM